nr:type II secretion system protein [Mesobacillus persicus]
MVKNHLKNQKGLTLIELLAVIVILGIIAAIAVPAIGGIINKTEKDAKVSEGIQIVNSAKMYMSAHQHKVTDATKPGIMVLSDTDLSAYLDNAASGFTVNVKKDTTTGKYTYEVASHDSETLVGDKTTPATETELLAY